MLSSVEAVKKGTSIKRAAEKQIVPRITGFGKMCNCKYVFRNVYLENAWYQFSTNL